MPHHILKKTVYRLALGLSCIFGTTMIKSAEAHVEKDIPFAEVDGIELKLDLYRPSSSEKAPLIVWVHGGAWRAGSRTSMPLKRFVDHGYAIASVDYRLSPVAPFPAQIHDIKASIRFLRAKAKSFNLDTSNITIAGASAGGHLVALVGTTNGHRELEGTVGQYLEQASDVQLIVSYYGASNLSSILKQSTPHGLSVRVPALQLLLGGQPEDVPAIANLASPVTHVDETDPPLLLLHGDQDPQMPINQSHELHGRYQALGLPTQLIVIHGAAHGGAAFYDQKQNTAVLKFLNHHLNPN